MRYVGIGKSDHVHHQADGVVRVTLGGLSGNLQPTGVDHFSVFQSNVFFQIVPSGCF